MDKAKAEFSGLAAKYPKNVSVQKGYVRALLEVKDYATAQTVVTGLMKKNAKDPEVASCTPPKLFDWLSRPEGLRRRLRGTPARLRTLRAMRPNSLPRLATSRSLA